jgi:hypothetical protein
VEVNGQKENSEMNEPRFNVGVRLIGEDGNAFAILGKVQKALREAGATKAEVDEYYAEATSGDYDNLLRVSMAWVDVE